MKMIRAMRQFCNIHAEQAGYGEPLVDSDILIYLLVGTSLLRQDSDSQEGTALGRPR
ncbi:hypothetical protein AUP68_05929 [Ilyonectria robusta]